MYIYIRCTLSFNQTDIFWSGSFAQFSEFSIAIEPSGKVGDQGKAVRLKLKVSIEVVQCYFEAQIN